MRLLRQRKRERVDRRMALEGVPTLRSGVAMEALEGGAVRVSMTIKRGGGFFESMRPPESRRSYELDEFGSFVIRQVDGKRTVLDVVNAFEQRFRMSRREVELSVVAFIKLLMQRNVLAVAVPRSGAVRSAAGVALIALALTAALALPGRAAAAQAASATLAEIRQLCEANGPRHPGAPGNLALEKQVEERFTQSGFETGEIRFHAPVFEPGSLTLDCGERGTFTLDAMHPTLMRPGNFAKSDFETRLLYLGQGDIGALERVRGIDLEGAIAVMEYDCGDRWLDLLRFGFEGFIFVGKGSYLHEQSVAKVYNSEVAVPRFFIDGDEGRRLLALCSENRELPAKVHEVPSRWRNDELRDLWVLIPGADSERAEKVIVLTAALDANSVVPGRAFGAQRAVNLHVLMKLLDDFREKRPLYSVMLVAVNAHTQRYAGERQLAWHLMADEADVENMRDEIAAEMRLARLHSTEYGKLNLDPVADADKAVLHVLMDVLWQLDHVQRGAREQAYREALETRERAIKVAEKGDGDAAGGLEEMPLPELDEVLDLSAFNEQDVRAAIDAAEEEMISAYGGFFAKRGRDPQDVEREKREDLALIEALRAQPFEELMATAKRIKSTFDDEKLFEEWRSTLDKSTGRRVYVKTKLQDEFMSRKNRTMQDLMMVSDTNRTTMASAERVALKAALEERRANLSKVLVLFNKLDIGVGRSRTRYRQIAVSDVHRELLKSVVDEFVETYGGWQEIHDAALERDTASGAVRTALGSRRVALVVALELDAQAERLGFSYHAFRIRPGWFNGFGRICAAVGAGAAETDDAAATPYVDALNSASGSKPTHYFSLPDSGIFYFHSANQTPAFAMKSAFSEPGELFGPADTVDRLDPERVHALQAWVRRFYGELLANAELLSSANLAPAKGVGLSWSTLLRSYYLEQFTGKPIPTRPVPGCLVALYESYWPPNVLPTIVGGDVVNCYMAITDDSANSYFYGLAERRSLAPTAYLMDPDFREVLFTIDKGRIQSSKQIDSNVSRSIRATMPMFECREFVIKDRRDPALVSSKPIVTNFVWPKVAQGQSDPEKYGVHGAYCLSPARSQVSSGPIGIYLYRRRAEMAQDALMIITDTKRCILNASEENPQGEGFLNQKELGSDVLRRASKDMAYLNKSRSVEMKGVVNQLLDEFLERGDRLNEEADARRAAHDHVGYLGKVYEAFGNEVKAYTEIQKMNADMLKAVIAYMALMLPFCFFLQKLLFNFRRLEHELAGFSLLFVGMFLLFRFIHPAFRMAMCPEAIFIAFVLGAIGVFTTGVLHARFNEEMTILFRGVGGIGEEVGYGTVGSTAMLIGVQNMRRRRVRTTLTTVTIVLVVFTMLAFSSVSRKAKPTLLSKADTAPYTGLFYHWPSGVAMDEGSHRAIRDLFSESAEVRVRRILKRGDPWRMERVSNPDKAIDVVAVTGLPMDDGVLRDSMALVEGEQFSSAFAEEILLTISAADALGLGASDVAKAKVKLMGREWLLKGLVDDQRYRLARDLNPNLPLVPMATIPTRESGDDADSLDVEVANVSDQLIDTSGLVMIPEGLAAELGAAPRSVSVSFTNIVNDMQLGAEVRRVLDVTQAKFYVGSRRAFKLDADAVVPVKSGVYYVGSSYRTAIGGLARLIIPLLIAGSIILNTMLGTVYERKSEIAVFNAIGLNPTHIFMFFLAEAIVYSFIGAVGGYLIGQILTILLKAAGLIKDVNINFSSLMVVYAVLFTMTLVILSTLYPGYVATRTAVPSGKRKWSMPDHDGQHMSIVFPFIYRPRLAYGVMYYIQQFFEPLADQSMGDIVAELQSVKAEEDATGKPVLSIRYSLALAPYDLGVTQCVTFTTQYDEVVKSFRLHMEVDRVSGRDTNWVTTNRPFLERMRKFLIRWRNIDPTRQAWFVKHAVEMFSNGVPPVATGTKE